MLNMIGLILIIFIICCSITFIVGNFLGKKKGIEIALKASISVFEQQHIREGLTIFNEFLEFNFLKYIHNILVQIASKNKFVIKGFLDSSLSEIDVQKKLVGFATLMSVQISKDLKNLFYRYYNAIDEEGNTTNILEHYISEWFLIRMRKLNAEYVSNLGDNMSEQNLLLINSRMFISLELDLYNKMGFITPQQPKEVIKQPINKNLLK